jgi:replicative DNA helicase
MNAHALPAPETIANIEAEQALLGTLLVNSSLYDTLHTFGIEARHFSEAMHGHIFDACGKLIEAGKAANPVTVRGYIPEDLNVGGATPAQYLARLATSSSMGASHLGGLAQAVIHAWMRREMLGTSQAMAQMAQDALGDMELADGLQALQTRLMECQRALDGEQAEGVSMADAVVSSMDQTYAAVKGSEAAGINTGIPAIHQMIGPLGPGQLLIVGGMTKHGKSSLAQQIARGAADNGHPVYIYSGEMPASEITMREKARDTGISVKQQREGRVSEGDLERLAIAGRTISKLPIKIQDRRRTLDKLTREIRAFVAGRKGQPMPVIVIDSMLLIEKDRSQWRLSDFEFGALVSDRMKALARDLSVPVVLLGQLKKNTIEKSRHSGKITAETYRQATSRRPRASDLYGSVEKDADHVVIVYNPEVVLRDLEPSEASDDHIVWDEVLREHEGKAEILLSISRSANWPSRRTVNWDGARHHFAFPQDAQKGLF